MAKKKVKFIKAWRHFVPGDELPVNKELYDALIEKGVIEVPKAKSKPNK